MHNILTVYYSRTGNTKTAAEAVAAAVGSDLFRVETVEPYSEVYQECVQRAVAEWKGNVRPEIREIPADPDRYDTVFVCYPLWCGTMPMCLYTLLEQIDLSGKRVLALCTNEGSGLANSVKDLERLCPGAVIADAIEVKGSKLTESIETIFRWAQSSLNG